MLRRDARLRKEYLYRKSLEEKEVRQHEKKIALKAGLECNIPLQNDVKKEALELAQQLAYDDGLAGNQFLAIFPWFQCIFDIMIAPSTSIDDEYAAANHKDPKILVTTSRDPSSRLQQFAKEIRLILPNAQRINRGNHVIPEIVKACRSSDVTDLVILHEHRGIPDGLIVSHFPYGPTAFFSLHNVVLRHDIRDADKKTISEAYPHLIFSNFSSKLGARAQSILKHLFPVPKESSKRTISFINQSDFISFRYD